MNSDSQHPQSQPEHASGAAALGGPLEISTDSVNKEKSTSTPGAQAQHHLDEVAQEINQSVDKKPPSRPPGTINIDL